MVHAWNDQSPTGIPGERRDEGMAYALEEAFRLAAWGIVVMERNFWSSDQICDPQYLRGSWTMYWKKKARPELYPGGQIGRNGPKFLFDSEDFHNLEARFRFQVNCDKFAHVLNQILEEKGCCCRLTCNAKDRDPEHIGPGVPISPVFRDY